MTAEPNELLKEFDAAWSRVARDADPASAPSLPGFVARAKSDGPLIEGLVKRDATQRHTRGWIASILHYRSVLGAAAVAPGTGLARALLVLELALGRKTAANLAQSLGPRYAADIDAVAEGMAATRQPAEGAATPALPTPTQHRYPGEEIGKYTLRALLGRGGFGEVWLADREDPHFKVAIKFLRPDRVDPASVARFRLERQALASLNHEGIAKIHDSGVLPDGSPFAVIQFIEGEPIDAYCDRNKVGINERLELFAKVCDAVHHAHQNQFIHRDLSPDNILVTLADGKPQPKIIDFGIARVANKNLKITDGTVTLDLHTLVGKPEYMAPEQAEAGVIGIDTRADIFSLGVILYQLITGVLPLPKEELRERAIEAVLAAVRGERPDPSTKFLGLDPGTRETSGVRRGLTQGELAALLRGRIRHLPMTALRSDRTKRFSSAMAFGLDVRNYLTARDFIEAASEPLWDTTARNIRRHKGAYSAASLLVLALIAGGAGITWQAGKAKVEREKRMTEAALAEAVSNYLTDDFFPSSDPENSSPNVRVVEVLDRAEKSLDARFAGRPVLRARMELALGRAFLRIGEPERAKALLQRVKDAHLPELPGGSDEVVQLLAESLWQQAGRRSTEEATQLMRAEIARLVATAGRTPNDPLVLGARVQLAGALKGRWRGDETADHSHRLDEAAAIYDDVVARRTKTLEPSNLDITIAQHDRALVDLERGRALRGVNDLTGAKPYFEQALTSMNSACDRAIGYGHTPKEPVVLAIRIDMAGLLYFLGRLDDALSAYHSVFSDAIEVFGNDHMRTRWVEVNMARVLELREGATPEELRRAVELYAVGVEHCREFEGPASPKTVQVTTRAADACARIGETGRAEWLMKRVAEEVSADRKSEDYPLAADALAKYYDRRGQGDEAARWRAPAGP